MLKICPKCGKVMFYNSYFKSWICECGYIKEVISKNEEFSILKKKLDKERKQKERAIKYLFLMAQKYEFCTGCKNDKFDYDKSSCTGCFYNNHGNWEWDSGEDK